MKQDFFNFKMNTNGQKLYEFTDQAINWIIKNNFKNGILNLNIQHTSASLIVQENADPDVQADLINYLICKFIKCLTIGIHLEIKKILFHQLIKIY